jgi:hypothetical protein
MTGSMGSTERQEIALANTLVHTTSRNGRLESRMVWIPVDQRAPAPGIGE